MCEEERFCAGGDTLFATAKTLWFCLILSWLKRLSLGVQALLLGLLFVVEVVDFKSKFNSSESEGFLCPIVFH